MKKYYGKGAVYVDGVRVGIFDSITYKPSEPDASEKERLNPDVDPKKKLEDECTLTSSATPKTE